APADMAGRLWVHQLQLTIADMVVEAHDVHHPIASGMYYEGQKVEALRRASDFRTKRMATLMPKYPLLSGLHERVAKLRELQDYFASDRRLPFGDGIFRHYPELDKH
ncbi:MAG: glutathione S-transferase, partial [Burkholderiaceae bacterium]